MRWGIGDPATGIGYPRAMPCPAPHWLSALAGRFIVFDGPDGSGKSTQFRRFCAYLEGHGLATCQVREPGGSSIGEQIRRILLDPANAEMDMRCEMLLYMASRAQLVGTHIVPALKKRQCVVADRFISSTVAYQGAAGGVAIEEIIAVGQTATAGLMPDLVVIFDVDQDVAATRLNPLLDRIEQRGEQYHRIVREGFLDQARTAPDRYAVIDASPTSDVVFDHLLACMAQRFGNTSVGM